MSLLPCLPMQVVPQKSRVIGVGGLKEQKSEREKGEVTSSTWVGLLHGRVLHDLAEEAAVLLCSSCFYGADRL